MVRYLACLVLVLVVSLSLFAVGCGSSVLSGSGAIPDVLQIRAFTDSMVTAYDNPAASGAPDDIDVNLTPIAYSIAFKRILLKQVDEAGATLSETEIFAAESISDALIVNLQDAGAADVLAARSLAAGTYNKVDLEVFYLDMTIPTIFPGSESHDIAYRMVFDDMGVLQTRDLLLYLEPQWVTGYAQLAGSVTAPGWYWMERDNPDHVEAVAGAAAHPSFNVLDLFANDAFWSQEHRVLEGGSIGPPLVYDPAAGGIVSINFNVANTFNFKDYHDASTQADGLWEIRKDGGIHPFPPNLACIPQSPEQSAAEEETEAGK